jgi:general secretion pathway protein A
MLSRLSGGIPRLINLLCDRALLGTYIEGEPLVNRRILAKAASEVFGKDKVLAAERGNLFRKMAAALVLLGGGSAVAYYAFGLQVPSHEQRVADAWAPSDTAARHGPAGADSALSGKRER